MKYFKVLITLMIIFYGACEEKTDNIEIFLQKQPGSVVGRVFPFDVEASVGLYQSQVILVTETLTNSDGTFLIKDIQPGNYLLRISALGYGTTELDEVLVSDGESMDIGLVFLSNLPWPMNSTSPENGTNDIKLDQSINMSFSRQLDSESILSAISINPTVLDLEIEDYYSSYYQNEHVIRINGNWNYGTQYEISIDTSLKTLIGDQLEFPIVLNYTFEHFGLVDVRLPTSSNYSDEIYLSFNGDLAIANFLENFVIFPSDVGNVRPSTYNDYSVYIEPPQFWHPGTTSITLLSGLSELGGNTLVSDTTFYFLIDSFAIESTLPFKGSLNVPVNSNVEIHFNYRIDLNTVANAITFEPNISYSIYHSYYYDYIELNPYSTFISDTTYTITIDTSLHDYWGNSLSKPYTFSFTTE